MICIQVGDKLVRASEFRTDTHRTIKPEELYDTKEKRESRIREQMRKNEKMRLI